MRKSNDVLRILIIVFAGLIVVTAIALIVYYVVASKKLKSIEITPDFMETQLDVGKRYTFSVKATPKKANLKKTKCFVDDPSCMFEYEDGKAVLTTGINEGAITVYVECGDIKSQVMTFNVVDSVAQAQKAQEEMQQQQPDTFEPLDTESEEASSADNVKLYVKCISDDVRVRAENNTDCEILGKAKNGEAFEKVEEVGDWTHIIYDGKDAYMKTEFLSEISETQYFEALQAMSSSAEEEKKEEEKKEEEKKNEENTQADTQSKEEAEAKAKADAEAQAAAELQAQMEAFAAAQAAAGTTIECADGPHNFRPDQYNFIKGHWEYTGEWEAMAHKHTYAELIQVCEIEGGIY